MTPAEELRAAAERLRSGDRFLNEEIRCDDHDFLAWLGSLVAGTRSLAAWLEALASGWEMSTELSPRGSDVRFADHPALAVARAINGTSA